jgi:hypothetical protein
MTSLQNLRDRNIRFDLAQDAVTELPSDKRVHSVYDHLSAAAVVKLIDDLLPLYHFSGSGKELFATEDELLLCSLSCHGVLWDLNL